ncbi:Protein spinster 3 [Aphanomyces cochlioides]|nr:Protein spinster 3 [Aphanomyces cochlioides]
MGDVVPHAASLFVLLNAITMIIFGGIVPAAPNEFQVFIQRTLDISPDKSAFYLGTLETAFVATYCLSSIVVGVFSKSIRPFRFMSYGLVLWVASAVMCGAARPADNFYVLCIGRMLNGIGESTFRVLTVPLVERISPESKRSLWMGFYYGGIAIGCGIAYFYGSVTARHLGWDWSFYLCAIAMTPLIYFCHANIPASVDVPFDAKTEATTTPTSVFTDIMTVLRSPIFAMITFVPAIFIGLRLFNEAWSSTIYGALVVVTGAIGSPVGGLVLDRACAGRESEEPFRLLVASLTPLVLNAEHAGWFILLMAVSCICIFATFGSSSIAILLSVPPQYRGLASGFALTIQNLLGNVPGPITLGYVKKWLAPGCGSIVGADNKDHIYPECFEEHNQDGLRKM